MKNKPCTFLFDHIANAQTLVAETYQFMRYSLGISSPKEFIQQRKELQAIYSNRYSSWSMIKKQSIRTCLLEKFVISIKNKYHLSIPEMKQVANKLSNWFQFRLIQQTDIIFSAKHCKIIGIRGVEINRNGKIRLKASDDV